MAPLGFGAAEEYYGGYDDAVRCVAAAVVPYSHFGLNCGEGFDAEIGEFKGGGGFGVVGYDCDVPLGFCHAYGVVNDRGRRRDAMCI